VVSRVEDGRRREREDWISHRRKGLVERVGREGRVWRGEGAVVGG